MGKTTTSKAGAGRRRARAATARGKVGSVKGKAGKRARKTESAASRLAELKRRIREMADSHAPAPSVAAKAPPPPRRSQTATARAKTAARAKTTTAARAKPARAAGAKRSARPLSVEARLADLKHRLLEMSDLDSAGTALGWDQATYMPKGGAAARARQRATLSRLLHEKLTDPAIGRLLDSLAAYADREPADSDDASLIRVVRRDYEKAVRVPADLVARQSAMGSASYDAWTRARPANDFATMRPFLERALDLSREYAGYLAPCDHIADPLIDDLDAGLTVGDVRALFDALRPELVPIVRAIAEQPPADDSCLRGNFPEGRQLDFAVRVVKRFGYDLDRGRLDKTHHPFCSAFSRGDVRITTRVKEDDIGEALFSTLHEAGHALYEQGIDPAYEGTPLASGTSMGMHESQSRLWENVVGRSRGFWQHFYPQLADAFPDHFGKVPLEAFYRAINKVARSLIRTDADEVTYNLHVMLRFDLELDLLEGRLKVKDLPEAWRARFQADLGLTPPDDRDGCLQDVHWYNGRVGGAFQSYAIGNILSAQLYAAAVKAHPDIPRAMMRGELGTLHGWLRERLYRHGRKHGPDETVRRATGSRMTVAPYIAYLRAKYGELYRLPPPARRF